MIRPVAIIAAIATAAAFGGPAASQDSREQLASEVKKFPEIMKVDVLDIYHAVGVYIDPAKNDARAVADKICAMLKKQRPEFNMVIVNDGPLFAEKHINKVLAPVRCP